MGTERLLTERSRYTGDTDNIETAKSLATYCGPCLLAPQTVAAGGPYYTCTIDMRGYEKALFCILGGAAGDRDATLVVEVLQATAPAVVAGTIATGGKSITGTGHATGKYISESPLGNYSYGGWYYYNANRKWLIEVDVEEMDVDNGFRYLQVTYTVAGGTWLLAMEAERSLASYEPCAQTYADQVIT
jgi:hypothetical protein